MCSYIIMSWMSSVSSISSVPWSFHVTMRFSPRNFSWTAPLSGLRDTASWCRFPVHAAPRFPWFPHVPQAFSLDTANQYESMGCTAQLCRTTVYHCVQVAKARLLCTMPGWHRAVSSAWPICRKHSKTMSNQQDSLTEMPWNAQFLWELNWIMIWVHLQNLRSHMIPLYCSFFGFSKWMINPNKLDGLTTRGFENIENC